MVLGVSILIAGCSPAGDGGADGKGAGQAGGEAAAAREIGAAELEAMIVAEEPPLILDVRSPAEYEAGHVAGASNIPFDEMERRVGEVAAAPDGLIVVYCESGRRAGIAQGVLAEAGFENARILEGNWPAWDAAGRPAER